LAPDTDEWSTLCHTCFTPGRKKSQYLFERLGELHSQSGCSDKEKKSLPLSRIESSIINAG
jgi:hypothetical protein